MMHKTTAAKKSDMLKISSEFAMLVILTVAVFVGLIFWLGSHGWDEGGYFSIPPVSTVDRDPILSELRKLGIEVSGKATVTRDTLPEDMSADIWSLGPNYGLTKSVCAKGGYDLSPFGGKTVMISSFPIREMWRGREPLDVDVMSDGGHVICVYKSVRKGSNVVPGIFPVKDGADAA